MTEAERAASLRPLGVDVGSFSSTYFVTPTAAFSRIQPSPTDAYAYLQTPAQRYAGALSSAAQTMLSSSATAGSSGTTAGVDVARTARTGQQLIGLVVVVGVLYLVLRRR